MPERGVFNQSESIALSIIRVFAMMLIVSCHIAQYYGFKVAWVLNVGVQIFFFMSGFLYGKLDSSVSPFVFYKKRFIKVYLPYIIWFAIVMVVYAAFHLYRINAKQAVLYLLNLQWFSTPIEGLNHLWFLTVLMVAYLLTTWLKKFHEKYPICCVTAFVLFCVVEFFFVKKFYSFCAWLSLYFIGMIYGYYYSKRISNIVLIVGSVILIVLGFSFKQDWLIQTENQHYSIWLHWVLGLFLFALLFRVLPQIIRSNKKYSAIVYLDRLSYEVYLTHHPLVLGPLSMLLITRYDMVNISLLLITVYILSRALHSVVSLAKKIL